MMRDTFKLISGGIAIGIYLIITGMVLYYFNYRSSEKPVHYVKKNSDAIAVSLSAPKAVNVAKKKKKTLPPKPKKPPKKVRNITAPKVQAQQSKRAKKKVKKIQAKSLFSSVHTPKANKEKQTKQKAAQADSAHSAESLKKRSQKDKGVENAYFASVQEKLQGWPEQANFAGEQIAVLLTVYSSGRFDFKVKRLSSNSEFNEALIAYLKQLQSIGLGKHSNPKPYQIEVEFEATE